MNISETIRPNDKRAKNTLIMIWIILVIESISLVSGYFQYDLLNAVNNGEAISDAEATANDLRQQMIGIANLLAYIATIVVFIQWFRRAYYNLHLLSPGPLAHNEEWALWAWFVPIISLFRPYRITREMYTVSKDLLAGQETYEKLFNFQLIGWWWGFWLVSNFAGQLSFRLARSSESLDDYITGTIIDMVANVTNIVAALLVIQVIRNYSAIETQLYDNTGELGMDRLINSIGQPERVHDPAVEEEY